MTSPEVTNADAVVFHQNHWNCGSPYSSSFSPTVTALIFFPQLIPAWGDWQQTDAFRKSTAANIFLPLRVLLAKPLNYSQKVLVSSISPIFRQPVIQLVNGYKMVRSCFYRNRIDVLFDETLGYITPKCPILILCVCVCVSWGAFACTKLIFRSRKRTLSIETSMPIELKLIATVQIC